MRTYILCFWCFIRWLSSYSHVFYLWYKQCICNIPRNTSNISAECMKGISTYLGAAPIVQCLERYEPNVVITSRVADAALFLAPMVRVRQSCLIVQFTYPLWISNLIGCKYIFWCMFFLCDTRTMGKALEAFYVFKYYLVYVDFNKIIIRNMAL